MAIITVSRGSFSGGKLLAECLSERLGYRCVDRDSIVERASAFGVKPAELEKALTQPPGFLSRLNNQRRIYLTLVTAALKTEARQGKLVYHGNAGHLLLRDLPQLLRVRVVAPLHYRLAAVKERMNLEGDAAAAYIRQMDAERSKWTRYLYGVDWEDPSLYDMVLNLERVTICEACETVIASVRHQRLEEGPEFFAAMEDLVLASQVGAKLVLDPATAKLEIETTARKGVVSLRGKVPAEKDLEQVRRVAGAVPGVAKLDLELLVPEREV